MRADFSRKAEEILFDPQTSGGLLLSVPGHEANDLVSALQAAGVATAVRIAEVEEGPAALESRLSWRLSFGLA